MPMATTIVAAMANKRETPSISMDRALGKATRSMLPLGFAAVNAPPGETGRHDPDDLVNIAVRLESGSKKRRIAKPVCEAVQHRSSPPQRDTAALTAVKDRKVGMLLSSGCRSLLSSRKHLMGYECA
jgi:hypothetical protein